MNGLTTQSRWGEGGDEEGTLSVVPIFQEIKELIKTRSFLIEELVKVAPTYLQPKREKHPKDLQLKSIDQAKLFLALSTIVQ